MTETHIGFLYNAASVFNQREVNETYKKLRSYYLMRCKDVSRGYGLPKKHFSETTRCSFCCLEWDNKCQIKLHKINLSKRQRRRIRSKSKHKSPNEESLVHNKEIEKICSFCGKSIKAPITKPNEPNIEIEPHIDNVVKEVKKPKNKKGETKIDERLQSSVYCQSNTAFALNKQKNTLPSTIKAPPKIIKNNKKKKDKFAGLCQKAVIAATKLKKEKENENKLNLFLRPSK